MFKAPAVAKQCARYDWIILTLLILLFKYLVPHHYLNFAVFSMAWLQFVGLFYSFYPPYLLCGLV
jgi:hypothetical protein